MLIQQNIASFAVQAKVQKPQLKPSDHNNLSKNASFMPEEGLVKFESSHVQANYVSFSGLKQKLGLCRKITTCKRATITDLTINDLKSDPAIDFKRIEEGLHKTIKKARTPYIEYHFGPLIHGYDTPEQKEKVVQVLINTFEKDLHIPVLKISGHEIKSPLDVDEIVDDLRVQAKVSTPKGRKKKQSVALIVDNMDQMPFKAATRLKRLMNNESNRYNHKESYVEITLIGTCQNADKMPMDMEGSKLHPSDRKLTYDKFGQVLAQMSARDFYEIRMGDNSPPLEDIRRRMGRIYYYGEV